MNKNEFYKQLMIEYTFDSEKIKRNAKKGKFAKQRVTPVSLGITAAVAACTVAAGTLAFSLLNNGGVNLLPSESTTLSAMSVEDRVKRALEQQDKERGSSEIHDVIVTFNYPMSSGEVSKVLIGCLDTESIPVKAVYFKDETKSLGNDEIKNIFEGEGASDIIGVVISCSGDIMIRLQSDPAICLVEILGEGDYDTALPVNPKDVETADPIVTAPPVTDSTSGIGGNNHSQVTPEPPPVSVAVPTEESSETITEPESSETVNTPPVETETEIETQTNNPPDIISTEESFEDIQQTFETAETTDIPETRPPVNTGTGDSVPEPETSAPVDAPITSSPPETHETETPDVLPEGVILPVNPEALSVETFIDADSAFFLNENTFFVKTSYDIALYNFDGTSESRISSAVCTDAKLCWVSESGGKLIIMGSDGSGQRNKLFLVDADAGAIYDLNAEDTVMDGTLVNAGYNSSNGILVMSIRENGVYYVCSFKLNGSELDFYSNSFESEAKTTIMCSEGNNLYLSTYDGSLTLIHAVDLTTGESRIVKSYDNNPSITKNLAFTHAVISPSENAVIGFIEIFDPKTENVITTDYFGVTVNFGASSHSYSVGANYYTINGGSAWPSGGLSVTAPIDYRRSMSESYVASVTSSGTVKIGESAYNKENNEANLTFENVKENASSELRAALDGAIGINNAFALKQTRESGISDLSAAEKSIAVYYSKNAAEQLISKIGLTENPGGKLKYSSSGLKAFSADNSVLVINSENNNSASGVLYIKAGNFNGKTAYRSLEVSFVFENGAWKLDSLL